MAEMDKLFEHIDDIEIAMLTTRRPDGHLCSRAMATQKRAAGADIWFVTLDDTGKLRGDCVRPAREPVVLQRPHARMGIGIGHSHHHARSARRFASCGRRTGRRGSRRETTRGMERPMIRAWC